MLAVNQWLKAAGVSKPGEEEGKLRIFKERVVVNRKIRDLLSILLHPIF